MFVREKKINDEGNIKTNPKHFTNICKEQFNLKVVSRPLQMVVYSAPNYPWPNALIGCFIMPQIITF